MANPLIDIFRVKELRDRILFTIGILVIYRLGTILPVPGINIAALKLHFAAQGPRQVPRSWRKQAAGSLAPNRSAWSAYLSGRSCAQSRSWSRSERTRTESAVRQPLWNGP